MTSKKEFVDRRKHKRFKVKDGAIVAVVDTEPGYTYLGRFINISTGGLAFKYDDWNGKSTEPFKLDILSVRDRFYLYDIPVKTVWVTHEAGKPSFGKTGLQGVEFGEIPPFHIQHLDSFIEKYTIR